MIVTPQTQRLHSLEQIRDLLDGNGAVDFRPLDREEAYGFVRRTLVRLDYAMRWAVPARARCACSSARRRGRRAPR